MGMDPLSRCRYHPAKRWQLNYHGRAQRCHKATPIAGPPYRVSVQLLGQHDLVIAQREKRAWLEWHADLFIRLRARTCPTLRLSVGRRQPARPIMVCSISSSMTRPRGSASAIDAAGKLLGIVCQWAPLPCLTAGEAPVAAFANGLELTGYELEPRLAAPGASTRLVLNWQAPGAFPANLSVFVHLIDDVSGERIAQADGPPDLTERTSAFSICQIRRRLAAITRSLVCIDRLPVSPCRSSTPSANL